MAGETRSRRTKKEATPSTPLEWQNVRELWDRASSAELDLERAGKPVTLEAIWRLIKRFAPDDQRGQMRMPTGVREALDHAGYRQLVDIRKRMLVLPALKDLGILKELTGQAAVMAMTSAMDDLMVHPERISTSEKRQLARTFMEMNLRIGKPGDEKTETGTDTVSDIAAVEEAERERVMMAVPEAYRELMGQKWDEERLKGLRTRQAIHMAKMNENMGHAKSN